MSLLSSIRRWFFLFVALSLPFAAVGLSLGWIRGLIVGEVIFVSALLALIVTAERGILKVYRAREDGHTGVRASLGQVLLEKGWEKGGRAPHIQIFAHPSVLALVVRSPGGPGTILLSEGLLGVLKEDELRVLLRECLRRLRGRGMVLQSLCAWLAHLLFRLAPRGWVELFFGELRWNKALGPIGALGFVSVFSIAHFLASLGRNQVSTEVFNAPRSYGRLARWTGEITYPGSGILHLVDPWGHRVLLPL